MIDKEKKEENNFEKALAVVAGPYRLMQVLWFTLLYPEYSWSVVLLRYGENLDDLAEMENICKRSGKFSAIYTAVTATRFSSMFEMIKVFLQMIFFFFIGQRKKYCRRLVETYLGQFDYSLLCLACSYSLFEGAVLNFSDEIPTIMMQEGLGDYICHEKSEFGLFMRLGGKLLFKMKYVNFLGLKGFAYNKNCIKYATNPERLAEKDFLEIRKLFAGNETLEKDFQNLLGEVYQVEELDYDVMVFSSITQSISKDDDIERLRAWLYNHYKDKRILIKKHPQDAFLYQWDELNLTCKYTNVPGEVIVKLAPNVKFIFAFPSTLLLSMLFDRGEKEYDFLLVKYVSGMQERYNESFEKTVRVLENVGDRYIEL